MFPVTIASVDETHFRGNALSRTCPCRDGEVTILRNHVPFVAKLRPGSILVRTPEGEQKIVVKGGILEVHKGGATVLL